MTPKRGFDMNKHNPNMLEAYNKIGLVLTNPNVPSVVKELHACVHALIGQKLTNKGFVIGYSAVPKQPGWCWLNKSSDTINHGIMMRVGDNGRVYMRAHYKNADYRILGLTTQVPLEWFGIDALRTLCAQFAVGNTKAYGVIPMPVLAFKIWASSDLREMFSKLLYSKLLGINLDDAGNIAPYAIAQNKGFVRAEHNIKGFKGFRFPTHNEVKCVLEHNKGLYAFEDPSKLNERVVKIYGNTEGVYIGKWNGIHIISQPKCADPAFQEEVNNMFCTGVAYSSELYDFLGPVRVVTKGGGKIVIASKFHFEEFGPRTIVATLASWKGQFNMLLDSTGVMSVKEQVEYCNENPAMGSKELTKMARRKLHKAGLIRSITCAYRGTTITFEYVECEHDVLATNLYTLYGCQYKETDADSLDSDGYESQSMMSSYYLNMIKHIKDCVQHGNYKFMLAARVLKDIDDGVIVKRPPLTSFSIREFTNIFWSYCVYEKDTKWVVDPTVLNDVIAQVVHDNTGKANAKHKEMQRIATEGYVDVARITKEDFIAFMDKLFGRVYDNMGYDCYEQISIPERGWSNMETGLSSLTDEQFTEKFHMLMSGDENFPGLMSEHGSLVRIEGYDFFIPGWNFLKGNIMPVDKEAFKNGDSVECMFGSTIQTIMMLFVALRNEAKGSNVEWSFTAAQHLIRINAALFEDSYNRMIVRGTYLTIAPRFWNCSFDDYKHTVSTTACHAGRMTYSKDPVIFDKGVTGVYNDAFFPESIFGKLNEIDTFAMSSVCFVNNTLLMTQENDTDGDLCCLRYNIKLPLYDGQWSYMQNRANSYVWGKDDKGVAKPVGVVGDGEMKFEFAMKPWKYYTPEDLAAGIDSNRQAKENIGLMTNGLFQHSMLLENAIFNGGMNVFWAKMLWNLYGYIIQDEAMRMIKHSEGKIIGGNGRSMYYEATSVISLLRGKADLMFSGSVDADGNSMNDGFLQNIKTYWNGFDQENKKQYNSLKTAIDKYVAATAVFVNAHYDTVPEKVTPGQYTGRISSWYPHNIYLSQDLANRKCINSTYKLFNILQRGYFLHTEKTRLSKGAANEMIATCSEHGMSTPLNCRDVVSSVFEMQKNEVTIPQLNSMSLAFQLDTKVQKGYFAQHMYIGKLNLSATEKDICVLRWIDMVRTANNSNKDFAISKEERIAAKPEIETGKIVADVLFQQLRDALAQTPTDINYPNPEDWA